MLVNLLSVVALAGGYVDAAQVTWARPEKIVQRAQQYYPREAQRRRVAGAVLLDCLIIDGGKLDDCRPLVETPSGHGFGEAAVKMRVLHDLRTTLLNGEALVIGSRIQFPVRFALPGQNPPALAYPPPDSASAPLVSENTSGR